MVQEYLSSSNPVCAFRTQYASSLSKHVSDWQSGRNTADSSIIAENVHQTTPAQGYMDVQLLQPEFAFGQAQWLHSISVFIDGHAPETSVTPKFVYQCAEILTDLWRGDGGVLVGELLSVFQSSYLDLQIFQRHSTPVKKCFRVKSKQKDDECKSANFSL